MSGTTGIKDRLLKEKKGEKVGEKVGKKEEIIIKKV